ncbi:MAG: nucleotidyltransferase substrate binding protein [Bacteroidota bacterium]
MAKQDIRWIQRFQNFNKALNGLQQALEEFQEDETSEVVKVGMIKFFEMTYELAWLTMKDYHENQGENGIMGSKDAIKLSSERGLIQDPDAWFDMVDSRKLSVHTYDGETATEIAMDIVETYIGKFIQLQTRLSIDQITEEKNLNVEDNTE